LGSSSIGFWRSKVRQVIARENQLESLTDEEVRKSSLSLSYRARSGTPFDQL